MDLAEERTPGSAPGGGGGYGGNKSFGNGGGGGNAAEGTTVFVKGFDRSLDEESLRAGLSAAFEKCGGIAQIKLPSDRETGALKVRPFSCLYM